MQVKFPALALTAIAAGLLATSAAAVPVSFTALPTLVGGTLAGTGVYKADLSGVGLGSILSITIRDNSSGLGGSPGQFSGFDLDSIKLSTTDCTDGPCAAGATDLGIFDFVTGVSFTPGTQRTPADPKLFGTGPGGNTLDNAVATLQAFDAESTTAIPGAFGFISLGDDGIIAFNLTSAVSPTGLFLYIGEVGNNGEVAASNIDVSDTRVPEPATLALLSVGLAGLGFSRRKRAR